MHSANHGNASRNRPRATLAKQHPPRRLAWPVSCQRRFQYVTRMKISLDVPGPAHVVRSYAPGALRIGSRTYDRSLIVTATTIVEGWRPSRIEDLLPADLDPVLGLQPEVLLIGAGARQKFPDRSALMPLYAARVGFEIMDTGAACRTFNLLVAEGRNVAAALIVEPA